MFIILKDTMMTLPLDVALKLFNSLILPILEYGNEIWFCDKVISGIENVHMCFMKITLGVHKNVSNLAVRGELKSVYSCLLELHTSGFKTWVSSIEFVLKESDLRSY